MKKNLRKFIKMSNCRELINSFIYNYEPELILEFTQNICCYYIDEKGNILEGIYKDKSFEMEMEPENFAIIVGNKKAESYSNVGRHFRRFYEFVHNSDNLKTQKITYHIEGLKCKVKKTKIIYTKIKCEKPTFFESFFIF